MLEKQTSRTKKDFDLLDNAVISLIVEKTKLNKEKYSLILSKTVIVYILLVAMAMYSTINKYLSTQFLSVGLIIGTLFV